MRLCVLVLLWLSYLAQISLPWPGPGAASGGTGPGGISATGLQVWYRGDNLTCTGGCTGTNTVTSFNDLSTNANNCTPIGSPTFLANAVNSKPGVTIQTGCTFGSPLAWGGAVTVFVVWANTSTTNKSSFLQGASGSFKNWSGNGSAQNGMDKTSVVQIAIGTAAANTSFNQQGATYDGTNWAFYIASTTDGSGANAQTISASDTTIGCNSCGEQIRGTLVEFFSYSRILTGPEITTAQAYLHGSYGT